jgi:hypothetical protein
MLKRNRIGRFLATSLFVSICDYCLAQSLQQPPASQAPKTEQSASQDKRGTKDQPLTVNVIPTAEQKAEAEKQAAEAQQKGGADEELISYTGDLVLVGIVQFGVFVLQLIAFIVQAIYIRRSAVEMRKTTEAAEQVSRDQIAHSHKIERAYISGGGARDRIFTYISAANTPVYGPGNDFVFTVNNYGKTAGELREIGYGFCDIGNIPAVPIYERRYFYDWVQPGDRGRTTFQIPIPTDRAATAVYGRFYYRDIFGKNHSCGFINRIVPNTESVPIPAPSDYTAERDED